LRAISPKHKSTTPNVSKPKGQVENLSDAPAGLVVQPADLRDARAGPRFLRVDDLFPGLAAGALPALPCRVAAARLEDFAPARRESATFA
jgi:hypothetical protein